MRKSDVKIRFKTQEQALEFVKWFIEQGQSYYFNECWIVNTDEKNSDISDFVEDERMRV